MTLLNRNLDERYRAKEKPPRRSPMPMRMKIIEILTEQGHSTKGDIKRWFAGSKAPQVYAMLDEMIKEGKVETYLGKRGTVDCVFYKFVEPPEEVMDEETELKRLRREVRDLREFKARVTEAVLGKVK